MVKRLQGHSLDAESERDVPMALEELEVMWEELQGQAELLSREHERYAEFFEFAPDAYVVTDAGANVREANQAACELFRTSREDLVGAPLSSFIAEGDRVGFLSRFVSMVVHGGTAPQTWQSRIQAAEGSTVGVTISVRSIPLKKSGIGGLCWLVRPLGPG
jgi:PAS domain S-box-containing protein